MDKPKSHYLLWQSMLLVILLMVGLVDKMFPPRLLAQAKSNCEKFTLANFPKLTNQTAITISGQSDQKPTAGSQLKAPQEPTYYDGQTFVFKKYPLLKGSNKIIIASQSGCVKGVSVQVDTTPPEIILLNPKELNQSNPSAQIIGRVTEPSTMLLNSQPLKVQGDNSFEVAHNLNAGNNEITLIAKDFAGNQSKLSITLTYQPQIEQIIAQNPQSNSLAYKLVIDIASNKEYLYQNDNLIDTQNVSTGDNVEPYRYEIPYTTPVGIWQISRKVASSNEYGPYYLALDLWDGEKFVATAIGLHGTNEENLIGEPASHGCIRHYNETITKYYNLLPIGTIVETK